MTYTSIAISAGDYALVRRVASCAAQEGVTGDATAWATQHIWEIVSSTEIEEAYEYALGTENPNPGGDEGVITDAMILANVQPMLLPPPEPTPPES
jgi:hypothetical protein